MQSLSHLLVICGAALLVYMTLGSTLALALRNNGIADIMWGTGFVLVAAVSLLRGTATTHAVIVAVLFAVWGARLTAYIFLRSRGKPEDARYAELRSQWGAAWPLYSYFKVFLLQGALIELIGLAAPIAASAPKQSIGLIEAVGAALWATGLTIEAVSDWQKSRFYRVKRDPQEFLDGGLWHYSRHPNYFGEALAWWGIALIVVRLPWGWLGLVSAATITVLVRFVSGVPLLERKRSHQPAWQRYCARTNVFIPGPTRAER